jgi:molybdate transport system regulatory protein
VLRARDVILGPGKADLLEAIGQRGSLRLAARALGMSYMRAWKLVQMLNRGFRERLVVTQRGGAGHGAARLTPTGRAVLAVYREMERKSLSAAAPAWRRLQKLLRLGASYL